MSITNLQTVIMPDALEVVSDEERQQFVELIKLKNQIDELQTRYDARRKFAELILERAQAAGLMDKTFVISGTLITYNTRKNYIFSQNVAVAEGLLKTLKRREIESGIAQEAEPTTFLSINAKANPAFDRTNNKWLSAYQVKAA